MKRMIFRNLMLDCLGGIIFLLPDFFILVELFLRDMKAGRAVLRDPSPMPFYFIVVLLAVTSMVINRRELSTTLGRWSAWLTNLGLAALNLVVAYVLAAAFSWVYLAIRIPK